PFGGGLLPELGGRCEATATLAPLDIRRRVALWASLTTGFTAAASIQVDTPLRAAPARALRVMSGARVT
ncbi:MAG: hypothetical protein KIT09_35735, partial [Bryobacteraceae bacterium]|nr:hypothetical protein [Bryobacteraceae bacterium]